MGYNIISDINGIFNKITNNKYNEKEEFGECDREFWELPLQAFGATTMAVFVLYYIFITIISPLFLSKGRHTLAARRGVLAARDGG